MTLNALSKRAFDRLATDLRKVFGARFVALVASGQTSSVAFASSILPGDLDACGVLMDAWRRDTLAAPLILTPDEFRRSIDAFPVEYQGLIDEHIVIDGTPPFDNVPIDIDELRRACEIQAKSHLLHLRQGWIEAGGHEEDLADVLIRSAAPLRILLAHVARLTGTTVAEEHAALAGARVAGLPVVLISSILALDEDPEQGPAAITHFPAYLDASERLWAFVDRWRH